MINPRPQVEVRVKERESIVSEIAFKKTKKKTKNNNKKKQQKKNNARMRIL